MNGDFKRIIEETKGKHDLNGNITNRDLILYLLNRQDTEFNFLKEKFKKGSGKIGKNHTYIKWMCGVGSVFGIGISSIIAWLFIQLYNIK